MNDKVLLNNYLLVLKSTIEVYVHGTLESTNQKVRVLLNEHLNNTIKMQATTYDEMKNYGWYKTENVNSKIISDTLSKINSKE